MEELHAALGEFVNHPEELDDGLRMQGGLNLIEEDDRLLMLSLISDIASTEKLLKDSSKLGFFRGL